MIFGTLAAAHIPKSDSATAGTLIIRLLVYHFIPLQHTDKATCPSALDLVKHFTEDEQLLYTPLPRVCCHNLALLFITAQGEVAVFQLERRKVSPKI